MTLRVLHVFAPNYRLRFTGPVIQWRYYFNNWSDTGIKHFVLDATAKSILPGKDALNFELTGAHKVLRQSDRATWIIALIHSLTQLQGTYDLLHVHILWWGSLLLSVWAKHLHIPIIYESVLLDSDNPSSILRERFGKLKLHLLRQYTGILAISDFLAEDYLNNGFRSDQVHLLPNSVDTELFHPSVSNSEKANLREKYQLPSESTILLFVGSLIYRKGFDILVKGFISACLRCPDLFLLAVGPAKAAENPSLDEVFISNLIQEISDNNLRNRVRFTGLIQNREKLAELYRSADLFVLPSRNEGLPSVLLEGMASGLVPVVTDLPVLRNVINQGVNGIKVPVDDVQALSDTILQLSRDTEFQTELAKNARKTILSQHGFESWQQDLSEYYYALKHKVTGNGIEDKQVDRRIQT